MSKKKAKKSRFNGHAVISPETALRLNLGEEFQKEFRKDIDDIIERLTQAALILAKEDTEDCFIDMSDDVKERVLRAKVAYNK